MSEQDQGSFDQIKAELLEIISEVLGEDLPPIPDDTQILDFVLSSLTLVEGMRRIYEHFGVLVSIRRVIEGQATLGGIAAYIEQELRFPGQATGDEGQKRSPAMDESVRRLPLAPSQRHTSFIFRYSPEASAAYNETVAVKIEGPIDGPALQSAIDTVVNRYDALRTSLNLERDELNIYEVHPLELQVALAAPHMLQESLREFMSAPFNLGDRLFRAGLFRSGTIGHVLVLVSHGLVVDQEALRIILGEIAYYYAAYSRNEDREDPYPALQWTDYLALGEAEIMQSVRLSDRHYWEKKLTGRLPHLELPLDKSRPAIKGYTGARKFRRLNWDLFDGVEGKKKFDNLSVESFVLSVFALYLGRLSGQNDFLIGVRSKSLYLGDAQAVVGQTRTMLPIHISIDFDSAFDTLSQHLAQKVADANDHRNLSLAELIQVLDLPRDQSRSPLFTAAFSYEKVLSLPDFGQKSVLFQEVPGNGARYDIELTVVESDNGILLSATYSDELFEPETIDKWLDGFEVVLNSALQTPQENCGLLPVMTQEQLEFVLHGLNQTEAPLPPDRTVLDEIFDVAEQSPEAEAIRFGNQKTTYAELIKKVDEIAAQLFAAGIMRGDRVGVLLERSPDLIAALLAVWRIGAQYVPLDLNFPGKRLMYMLMDAKVAVLVTSENLAQSVPDFPKDKILFLGKLDNLDSTQPALALKASPKDAAYIIYTSGSTGQPKGVEIRHASLLNILLSVSDHVKISENESFLAITTISFDISIVEIFYPLMNGATVDIVPDGVIADSHQLIERIRTHQPAITQATPSIWKQILAESWEGDPNLTIWSSGENLSRELAEALRARSRKLLNLYGPTEMSIYSAIAELESAPGEPVPIGRPPRNTQCYVLDAQMQPVPFGSVGELYFGGRGAAIGYWGKRDLTEKQFVPNPFRPGEIMYRTGDLGRFLKNGEILCLGRTDHQVKVNGVRIELGEIESALRLVPGISDAVVTAWKDGEGDTRLVAHMTAGSQKRPANSAIRGLLRETLPEVMIPTYLMFHQDFPLTANGKIQRSALPAPDIAGDVDANAEAPVTAVEKSLAQIWGQVLKIDASLIKRESDFWDLGGHSLLIAPLLLEVRKRFQTSFGMREFFAASILRKLADLIETRIGPDASSRNPVLYGAPVRNEAWGRERMKFLAREAELPAGLAPVRGQVYQPVEKIRKLFMTGATGFLGAYLIDEILTTSNAELYCLVRPKRGEDERQRIEAQMRHYHVWREDEAWQKAWDERLHIVSGDVTLPRLGINDHQYNELANEVDAILHSAAHVNFIYPYESLRGTNVAGVHEIIRFAFFGRIKPVHHISTAAIWPMGSQYTFYEKDPITHGKVMNLGYDEAKWVAEMSLIHAGERGLPVVRYRPGEVGGDSVTGRCVTDHFLIASIKGFLQLGAFPELDIEVDVAPVDYVAKSIAYILLNKKPFGRAFHLTNPKRIHMTRALDFIRDLGYPFTTMPFVPLRDRLLNMPNFSENAMFAYQGMLQDFDDVSLQLPTYDTRETNRILRKSGIFCPPADEQLFGTYFRYLNEIDFIPSPEAAANYQLNGE